MVTSLLGVDIGGTKCAVVAGEAGGAAGLRVLNRVSFPTEAARGPDATIDRICEALDEVARLSFPDRSAVRGIGISCGGPLDAARGVVLSPPNLPGWDEVPIARIVGSRMGAPVRLQNDANACALAEWRFGAARGKRDIVFLTFGTGMGAGLVLGGRLYEGANGMAGEAGHLRLSDNGPVGYGKSGSFEGFCSGGGIAQLARTMALERLQMGLPVSFCAGAEGLEGLSAAAVKEAADSGDELAREVFRRSGEYLGRGLAALVDILNPEIIVIGSVFARARDLIWPSARAVLEREALPRSLSACEIASSALGEGIGDFAALAVALEAARESQ